MDVERERSYRPKTKVAKSSHLKFVFQGPDFKARVSSLRPFTHIGHTITSGWAERESLANTFGISRTEVVDFEELVNKGINPGTNVEDSFYITHLKQHAKFEIYVDADIDREGFGKMWKAVQNLRKENQLAISRSHRTRRHAKLMYAIYKGLMNGMQFPYIFKLLDESKYQYYKRKLPKEFSTKETLENEFFKHYERTEP